MTRSEVEAVTRPHKGEAALLCTAIGVLLDIREQLDELNATVNVALKATISDALEKYKQAVLETRDSAWTRAVPEPRMKGGRRA